MGVIEKKRNRDISFSIGRDLIFILLVGARYLKLRSQIKVKDNFVKNQGKIATKDAILNLFYMTIKYLSLCLNNPP